MSTAEPAAGPSPAELLPRVTAIVAETLDREAAEVTPHASLIDDLGAESIDFLDLQFRIESDWGVKLGEDELWRAAFDPQDAQWVRDGRLTAAAEAYLRERQPGFPWTRFAAGLTIGDLPRLVTPQTIALHLAARLAGPAAVGGEG